MTISTTKFMDFSSLLQQSSLGFYKDLRTLLQQSSPAFYTEGATCKCTGYQRSRVAFFIQKCRKNPKFFQVSKTCENPFPVVRMSKITPFSHLHLYSLTLPIKSSHHHIITSSRRPLEKSTNSSFIKRSFTKIMQV